MDIPTREERMRAMILSFKILPMSLFWNVGQRWSKDTSPDVECNNRWIPVEPSKSELSLTPVMEVTDEWLHLTLEPGVTDHMPIAQGFLLHNSGVGIFARSSFLCSVRSKLVYEVAYPDDQYRVADRSTTGEALHCLIIEKPGRSSHTALRGALFRRLSSGDTGLEGVVQLSYCCPVVLHVQDEVLDLKEQHVRAEALMTSTRVLVKYGELDHDSD